MNTGELISALVGDYALQPRPRPIGRGLTIRGDLVHAGGWSDGDGRPADRAIRTALVALWGRLVAL